MTKITNEYTDLQLQWLTALESGKYKRCKYNLQRGDSFCCLGLATKIATPRSRSLRQERGSAVGAKLNADPQILPTAARKKMMLRSEYGGDFIFRGGDLTYYNDRGASFKKIASMIRKPPGVYFANFELPKEGTIT